MDMTQGHGVGRILALAASVTLASPACALDFKDLLFWDTMFSSIEAETHSAFLATGGKRSLSLPVENTRAFLMFSTGVSLSDARRFQRGKMLYSEIDRQARLFVGIERSMGPVFASFGLGPSMAQMRKRNGGGQQTYGIAMQADLWIRPMDNLYIALSSAADSASQNWWNRARLGYRFAGVPFAIGPEFVASVARDSGKVKLGLHLGEMSLWKLNIDLSGGVMWDHNNRPDRYVSFSAYMRY